ncbi:hypothetical protein [Superficieibacter sp. HKU1]|uniref:hypothetical protein n=1 Tax=Superficieibacter sp. HKU1 TaxID=3031919 RepID=UPI0023E0B07C|nr:hypothetical protein [Superficieibacter sp. HKU1]WES70106.1 hypothetical protein P0H77_09070 [Superficieibacter sp. HKU1]
MYIPIFSESSSPQKRTEEIQSIFSLLNKQLKQKYPHVTLPFSEWYYVLLPGRIGMDNWMSVVSGGYHCLYRQSKVPFAIILHPEDNFQPIITDVLSFQNDFIYFIAFAISSPQEDNQLLTWINILMENKCVDRLPPHALLTFESGYLLL